MQVQDELRYDEPAAVIRNYSTAGPNYDDVILNSNYYTVGPNYDDVISNQPVMDTYDVIGHNQPRLKAANPPPVRDEAIETENGFHNAEQHIKKAKKRPSPDESPYDKTFAKEKDTTAMFEGGEGDYSNLRN